MLPALVGGSVIVSVVLSLPTLGPILLNSIMMRDTYLAGAIILLLGLLTVIGTSQTSCLWWSTPESGSLRSIVHQAPSYAGSRFRGVVLLARVAWEGSF